MGEWEDNQFRCGDIIERDADGRIIFSGPRFLRCVRAECAALVTHGQIRKHGGCVCGGVRLQAALRIKPDEQAALLRGEYELLDWERASLIPAGGVSADAGA